MTEPKIKTIDDAIELVKELYKQAVDMDYANKPISWALYKAWMMCDEREKTRK